MTTYAGTETQRATLPSRSRRLGPKLRKTVLAVHIAAAGIWLGLDIALGALVLTALRTGDDTIRAACLQAVEVVAVGPMIAAGVLTLASGIALGLGTKWGLVRYRWVAFKLVLNVALLVLVLALLRPGAGEAADLGRQLSAGQIADAGPGDLVFPPIVSTLAVSFALWLSVFKPWGRLRRR